MRYQDIEVGGEYAVKFENRFGQYRATRVRVSAYKGRESLRSNVRYFEAVVLDNDTGTPLGVRHYTSREFHKPWDEFVVDLAEARKAADARDAGLEQYRAEKKARLDRLNAKLAAVGVSPINPYHSEFSGDRVTIKVDAFERILDLAVEQVASREPIYEEVK